MPKRYDKVIKEILNDVVDTLITEVIGLKIVKSTAIETKLQITNEREADFILLVEFEDGSKSILHIEFQATNYSKMEYVVAGPLECLDIDLFKKQIDINVTGVLAITQAMLPLLHDAHSRILNIGSSMGRVATPFVGAYSASKYAVV